MPSGVYKRIPGVKYGNVGRVITEDTREKMRTSHLGQKSWNTGLKGVQVSTRKGKKTKPHTKETRLKMSLAKRGCKSHLWKGGISLENKRLREGIENRLWRESVFARDSWTCQCCGKIGGELNAHHINNFSQFPEQRTSIQNGITLCKICHLKFHQIYTHQNNNMEQITNFISINNK